MPSRVLWAVVALGIGTAACQGDDGRSRAPSDAVSTAPARERACREDPVPTSSPATSEPAAEPGDPRFVDATREAGLELAALAPQPVCRPPTCRLLQPDVLADFPEIDPGSDASGGALCQMERFSGGIAAGDVDDDGDPDIVVARLDGPVRLLRNDGAARFTDVTSDWGLDDGPHPPTSGLLLVDVDNDRDTDLVANTLVAGRPLLYRNDDGRFVEVGGDAGFAPTEPVLHAGYSVAAGDYDGDGFVDLYVTEYLGGEGGDAGPPSDGRLLRNRGAVAPGTFEDVTAGAGVSLAALGRVFAFGATFADFDDDGHLDLYVTGDFGTSRLFWNDGDGTFTEGTAAAGVGTEENGMGSASVDLDGDGDLDRFVSSVYDERGSSIAKGGNWGATGNRLFRNDGARRFTDVTDAAGVRDGQWGWGSAFVDATNSGQHDLVQASGLDLRVSELSVPYQAAPTRYWRRRGPLRFVDLGTTSGIDVTNARGVATLDADGDGRLDVVVASPGAAPRLFLNRSTATGDWVRVRVRGTASGTDAVGAVVTVRVGARTWRARVGSGSDYLGQSEATVHVGLGPVGPDVGSATVSVRFPTSGRTATVTTGLGRVVEVVEPAAG